MNNRKICKICGEEIGRSSFFYGSGKCIKCGHTKYNQLLTKEILIKEYKINKKSMRQIADKLNCSVNPIKRRLLKYNIKMRSNSRKGRICPEADCHKIYYCIESNCNNIVSYRNALYKNGICQSCANKKKWANPEFSKKTRSAILKSCYNKPNKLEKLLNKMLQKSLPKEYKFVGDGEIILGGLNPDFININGQKKIIELYGDYWHNLPEYKERDKRRIKTYKKYGYKTLIIWEHELKAISKVENKVKEFNRHEEK